MSNLDSLNHPSILDLEFPEALELITKIRANRRVPQKPPKEKKYRFKMKGLPDITEKDAVELLELLTGKTK